MAHMQAHPCAQGPCQNGSQQAVTHSLESNSLEFLSEALLPSRHQAGPGVNTLATILSRPGVRLEDAPASFFAGTALGGTGRFGSYAAPQVSPNPSH